MRLYMYDKFIKVIDDELNRIGKYKDEKPYGFNYSDYIELKEMRKKFNNERKEHFDNIYKKIDDAYKDYVDTIYSAIFENELDEKKIDDLYYMDADYCTGLESIEQLCEQYSKVAYGALDRYKEEHGDLYYDEENVYDEFLPFS